MYNFNIKQKPISSLIGMGGGIGGFVFGGGGDTGLPVEEVFDMKLYDGNGFGVVNGAPVNEINNGMNLDVQNGSPGGMVLIKNRNYGGSSQFTVWDTDRGPGYSLVPAGNGMELNSTGWGDFALYEFLDDGFKLGANNNWENGWDTTNNVGYNHIAWTFMKSEKFFDICKWSGEAGTTDQTIPHNLGCEPGMIIAKSRSSNTTDWYVYHTSLGNQDYIRMNSDAASNGDTGADRWAPTDTSFKAAHYMALNAEWNSAGTTSEKYIAYLFADDEANIKCGSYVGTGDSISYGGSDNSVNVGFKPQFILIKRASGGTGDWFFFDTARGINSSANGNDAMFSCPTCSAEDSSDDYIKLTSNGFDITTEDVTVNANNSTYIYMAIKEE